MLSQQYRMHPAISAWPAKYFYDAELVDGPGVHALTAPFHSHPCFPPLAFFDCVKVTCQRTGLAGIACGWEGDGLGATLSLHV